MEVSEKENKIRAITKLYYSMPKIQDALVKFSKDREIVPRYFEGFGKRPDSIQYPADILGWINKGATSLHGSEELWNDPLQLNSEITQEQMNDLRKGWDLLIDIDSPYLDLSKIAAELLIKVLEFYGINKYGIKFSGSKGFHIMVSEKAFPKEFGGRETKKMFPEWPRAIAQFLFKEIEPNFRKEVGKKMILGKEKTEQKLRVFCMNCERIAKFGNLLKLFCPVCGLKIERKDIKMTNRKLKCLNEKCAGVLEIEDMKNYYYCENCKNSENINLPLDSIKSPESFQEKRGEEVGEDVKFDLVLVAPRHLFRMPYSLHEKTALASIVIEKEEINSFNPKDAEPLKVKIRDFIPENKEGEAKILLSAALDWKKTIDILEENHSLERYKKIKGDYEKIDFTGMNESMFPAPIKKLLLGLNDGKKRGLFILITFLRALQFSPEYITSKVYEWNKKNETPLKEGYVKSQLDWHFRQKKQILPPNYSNESFYKDIGLIDGKQEAKNPIVDATRAFRKAKK